MLDVRPWCLFINSIGCTIQLNNSTDSHCCTIHSNNIAMPFEITVRELLKNFSLKPKFNSLKYFFFRRHSQLE